MTYSLPIRRCCCCRLLLVPAALLLLLGVIVAVEGTEHHHHHHRSVLLLRPKEQMKQNVEEEFDDHNNHYHHEKHHYHREVQSSKYCINGFSVYNASSKVITTLKTITTMSNKVLGRILLDTYPGKRINIIANPAPCDPITKCIKISLGDFQETIQSTEPYALYGDENGTLLSSIPYKSGYQNLSAWSYPTIDCTGIASGMDTLSVQLVPKTTRGYRYLNLKTLYIGTNITDGSSVPTQDDITAFVKATCDFLQLAIQDELLLRSSVRPDQFICQQRFNTNLTTGTTTTILAGNTTTNSNGRQPLSITYLIFIKLRVLPDMFETGGNPDLPATKDITKFVYGMLTETNSIDYLQGLTLSSYIKLRSTVPITNPFYNFTAITLVVQ